MAKAPKQKKAAVAPKTLEAERQLTERIGRPLGATLTGLVRLGLVNDFLDLSSPIDPVVSKHLREQRRFIVLGEIANGFFGPLVDRPGKTVDSGPVVYSDRQGMPQEIGGMNLGQLLSVWAFAPDFFKLGATTAKQWSLLHREQLGSEGDPELRKEIAAVLQLPGVRDLKSGAEVAKLLGPSRTLSLELWPAAPMLPIPAPNTEEGRAFDEGLKEMARRFADWAKEPGK